jgi:hypothetical protein
MIPTWSDGTGRLLVDAKEAARIAEDHYMKDTRSLLFSCILCQVNLKKFIVGE